MNEVGRELAVAELREESVVVISKAGRNTLVTMWVEKIGSDSVLFFAEAANPKLHFLAMRMPDGSLIDDSGGRIFVYEYLGDI